MEQLQRDRNYSNYLVRLVEEEARRVGSKDELLKFIDQLNRSINNSDVIKYIQDNNLIFDYQMYSARVKNLLEEFDKNHEAQINSSDYKQMQVDNKNYIVSNEGKVLEQDASKNMGELSQEFKSKQNEMVGAKTGDSLNNAKEVYGIMEKEKLESKFIPLSKVDVNNVPQELIMKVNFMIKNPNINYNDFQVDVERGTFINTKDNELYDVRRDVNTNQFQLFKANQAVTMADDKSENNGKQNNKVDSNDLTMFSDEELKSMYGNVNVSQEKKHIIINELNKRKQIEIDKAKENSMNNTKEEVKKKTLTKDKMMPILNSGYISTILVTLGAAVSGILIAVIILVNK
ncbi:MAG: hypothetical protein IJH34_02400 [Romboutsia sp.]|nr:hypothetical protein [Romboutsia sp.]